MRLLLYFVLILPLCNFVLSRGSKCYGLALEGGGTKGVYQAGAYKAFAYNLLPENIAYDVISGVSVGSLTAMSIACADYGMDKQAADIIQDLWLNVKTSQIFKNWDHGGILRGLLYESGILDSSPEIKLVNGSFYKLNHTIKRDLSLGMVDANTGKFVTPQPIVNENLIDYLMASSALPAIFPAVYKDSTIYIDGGSLLNIDIKSAITYCRSKGYEDKDIFIDYIFLTKSTYEYFNSTKAKSINMMNRKTEMQNVLKEAFLLDDTAMYYKDVNYRYKLIPKKTLMKPILGFIPLDTNPKRLNETFNVGYQDAIEQIMGINETPVGKLFNFMSLYTD